MASFVVVVRLFCFLFFGFFWGGGEGGCYVLFEKDFFFFLDGKSVMAALCSCYYMCMFV